MPDAKPRNLTAQAYETLRADILACRLRPDEKLKISEICTTRGFSLGAVREALSRLMAEGLVEAEQNKGFRVTPITQSDLEDLTRTRILIECECLRSAIRHGDLQWQTAIVSTLFELSRLPVQSAEDASRLDETWATTHRRFHRALVSACDNAWLLRLREILYAQSERYRSASVPLDRAKRDIGAEHQAIADAAMAGDTKAACAAMREHLRLTTRILIGAGVVSDAVGETAVRA